MNIYHFLTLLSSGMMQGTRSLRWGNSSLTTFRRLTSSNIASLSLTKLTPWMCFCFRLCLLYLETGFIEFTDRRGMMFSFRSFFDFVRQKRIMVSDIISLMAHFDIY